MSKKKAAFLACGVIYYDKWPSVRHSFHEAARRLRAQGYTLKSGFAMRDIQIDDPCESAMLPITEDLELDDELFQGPRTTYYALLLRSFHAVVVVCDMDKDEQEEELASIRIACECVHIIPKVITYHSDDWTC